MGIGYVVGVLGGAILAHAAYATIQYRTVLKITEEEFTRPPMDVMIELLLGLALCMWAGLAVPAKFCSVLPHSEENRIVSLPANLDFMIFNHRGRAAVRPRPKAEDIDTHIFQILFFFCLPCNL